MGEEVRRREWERDTDFINGRVNPPKCRGGRHQNFFGHAELHAPLEMPLMTNYFCLESLLVIDIIFYN